MSTHQPDIQLQRAAAAYAAMQRWLYREPRRLPWERSHAGLYRETAAPDSAVAYVWPFSRALLATLCLAGLEAGAQAREAVDELLRALERYWTGTAYASAVVPPGGDVYYDDNAWIALALILAYRLGLIPRLDRVRQLFDFAVRGWDGEGGGGVFWVQQGIGYGLTNHDRGTGATAGWAEVGFLLLLEELTGRHVPMARTMVDWVGGRLDASGRGHGPFWNVVRSDGSIDTNVWSYNQGVMLGARVLQYRLTADARFLDLAEAIARQTLASFGDFRNHPPSFNAMCFQNLLMLYANTDLQERTLRVMRGYGDWAWDPASGARDSQSNLFCFTDAGAPNRGHQAARLQDQGAMLQLYALLAWDPAEYPRLT